MAVKALARLKGLEAKPWMQAASARQSRRALALPGPEVVALLRALAACGALQQRIMAQGLRRVQEEGYGELQPLQLQALLEALAILKPKKLAPEHLELLEHVARHHGALEHLPFTSIRQ